MVQLESAINPPTGPSKASGHLVGALVNCQLGDKHENLSLPLKHFSLHYTPSSIPFLALVWIMQAEQNRVVAQVQL